MENRKMEEEKSQKKPLDLDWGVVLGQNDDEPPPELVIQKKDKTKSSSALMVMISDEFSKMSDNELNETLRRHMCTINTYGKKMPDNGAKLELRIKAMQAERNRRAQLLRFSDPMDVDECDKPAESTSSGVSNGSRQDVMCTSPQVQSGSQFALAFNRRMEEDQSDFRVACAFDREMSTLGRCNSDKIRLNRGFSQRGRQKAQSSSRQRPFQCATSDISRNGGKYGSVNGDRKGRAASNRPTRYKGESPFDRFSEKKDGCKALPFNGARHAKGQTVVLVDEDEIQNVETMERENKLAECMKNSKIFYPSREDLESLEICYKDMECLAPDGFLTSPIMNFYIKYLWLRASRTNGAIGDYHFFNTFFYEKLKQAVSYKGSDKGSFFVKFRRWWKGVNIFQKAYILVPIHEDVHWSLVIICIPDKEDESGPIVLHLDSLKLHDSRSIFDNIKSYLREEWNHMNQEITPSEVPIPKRIWKKLPRRIEDKVILVPQQKNDCDCGLFVLFFMERFIEQAPERLKKKDLEMFSKRWFKPEEASGLRKKIQTLLLDEFEAAAKNGCSSESSPPSSGGTSP